MRFTGFLTVCVIGAMAAGAAQAQNVLIGRSAALNNDYLGDNEDRWQTASYSSSWLFSSSLELREIGIGPRFELRARGQIVTPEKLNGAPPAGSRPYAGYIGAGAFSHYTFAGWDVAAGAELGLLGPSSGISDLHTALHDLLSENEPQGWSTQVADQFVFTPVVEAGYKIGGEGGAPMLRPFVTAQMGLEDILRAGVDISIGIDRDLTQPIRDMITGQQFPVRYDRLDQIQLTVGMDVASVQGSEFFPSSHTAMAENTRTRVRGSIFAPVGAADVNYGVTWMSEEFTTQGAPQVLGSIGVEFRF
ncbi:hypothetical protein FHS89_002614 [Rubricella aquisinus]|uniref:Uncharacterized protein n=1 Tax=Rubricella aquisinus TaxID=2028108 RepID=A0A840WRB3_9RHOB|nr:lipid A-modifier LpxR family protein [Rubricella aquisinus]MBB5516583.1 hypothetical protein [Rubricella aquisinus]